MFKKLALVCILLFVVSCTNQIEGQKVDEVEQPLDPCVDITCGADEFCSDGACSCKPDFKDCNGVCISESSCCSDSDCSDEEVCSDGSCEFSCSKLTCTSNKICDSDKERCLCPDGYTFCEEQDKCIPEDHCCDRFTCGVDERCLPTITSTEVCISDDSGKACKILDEDRPKTISWGGKSFDVKILNFFYLQNVVLTINDKNLTLEPGKQQSLDDFKVVAQEMREKGGRCLDFDYQSTDE